jgi:hypothetical protein
MEFVRANKIKATIQLNAGNGTAQQAADTVKWFIENGYDADVLSFGIGNEICFDVDEVLMPEMNGQNGKPQGFVYKSSTEYIQFITDFYTALNAHGIANNKVLLGAIGSPPSYQLSFHKRRNGGYHDWYGTLGQTYPDDKNWDAKVLQAHADKIKFMDIHIGYAPVLTDEHNGPDTTDADYVRMYMAASLRVQDLINEEKAIIENIGGAYKDDIKIQITEYGPMGGRTPNSLAGALFLASFFHVVLDEPKIEHSNHLPMINHWAAPTLIGQRLDIPGAAVYWDNTQTFVFRMYSAMSGSDVLTTALTGYETFNNSRSLGFIPGKDNVPSAESRVYYNPATKQGSVFIINKDLTRNTTFSVKLPFDNPEFTKIHELWHKKPMAENSFDDDDLTVKLLTYSIAGLKQENNAFTVTTKPISLVKIDFQVR